PPVSRSAASALGFGIYLVLLGAAVVVAPNGLLGLFGFVPTREVWIRVAGLLAAAIGYYYLRGAGMEDRPFFRWSIHGRLFAAGGFGALVALKLAQPQLLLFAAVDLAGATWTTLALRADARSG